MRIAVVMQGDPADAASWSGTPSGLIAGLRRNDCEVVPVNARVRGAGRAASLLRMNWAEQEASRGFATVAGRLGDRHLRAAGPLDGIVTVGTSYELSMPVPTVTFEDMTVAQAVRVAPGLLPVGAAGARRWVERQGRIYRRCVGCCMASEWAASSAREDYGVEADRVHVVGCGSDLVVAPHGDRDWSRPSFLFTGFDWERKRGEDVLAAFAAVRERFPAARLDLVGGHPPVDAPGVTGHGVLALDSEDSRRRLAEIFAGATCFVMPSALEAFGIAYVEAGRSGIASIGTTVGGAADAIGDGGVLVEPGDRGALVAAMSRLADPVVAQGLGARAGAHAAGLTWTAVAARVLQALRLDRRSP